MSGTNAPVKPVDEKFLGQRLQAARQKAGLTQQQMCQRADLSYSTLAKIERGAIKSPSIFTIQHIAGVLGVSLDELIGNQPSRITNRVLKKTKSGVSFIYFDVNGCLVRFYHRAFTRLAEETGISPDVVETAFWHFNDAACRGQLTIEEFNKVLAKRLKIPSVDWLKYYLEAIDPIKDMHELVATASTQYKIGLLTNIMPGFIATMIEKGYLPNIEYDQIVDSSIVGSLKPEKAIYEVAQKAAGCPPSEILLIDDSRGNLMPAEREGWHVLWFDDYRPEESLDRIKKSLEPAS